MSYRDETLAGEELSERESAVLAMADAGSTDAEIAERFGYASANGAGNVRRVALTKSGRGGEVNRSRGGGRAKAVVPDFVTELRSIRDRAEASVSMLRERMNEAESAAKRTPKVIVETERARLVTAMERATEAVEKFDAMSADEKREMVEAIRTKDAERLTSTRETLSEQLATAEASLNQATAMLATVASDEEPEEGDEG